MDTGHEKSLCYEANFSFGTYLKNRMYLALVSSLAAIELWKVKTPLKVIREQPKKGEKVLGHSIP
jgi:hypothetical protein